MQIQSLSEPIDSGIFGGKAGNLSELIRIKLPVPKGFAIGKKVHSDFEKDQLNEGHFLRELSDFLNAVGAIKYMVRSSAIGEDSLGNSFAGQLESFISDPDLDSVYQNIKRCWNSYHSEAVLAYQSHTGRCLDGMGVVVQELIEPEFAGVIFTRSHLQHDQLLVEYVAGHGELLVSGQITPKQFHYNPEDGQATGDWLPVFQDCISLAQRIEQHYKFPCDIEWAFKEGSFFIVQSRPITTSVKQKIIYWSNTNVNENYPGPISPLLYSIARQSYYNYFKNLSKLFSISDPDIRRLESAFTNVIGVHGAKMYYNMSSIHEILSASPFGDSLIKSFDNF
ncbi:MAG: PEP/pyruvate-binding domain-containing protein, partial [Flavobacteriales bacterium]